jgi:SAM-dependent methyltransferase
MGRFPNWLDFFGHIADHLVARFRPRRVLDVGCAMGILVESLVDRGVDAYGLDISEYAIGESRPDIRHRLQVCDVLSEPPAAAAGYDLVVSIEVAEHLPPERAEQFIRFLCSQAPCVVFSSTPSDFEEPTHQNVQPTSYWVDLFRRQRFRRVAPARFITPWALVFCAEGASCPSAGWLELRYKRHILRSRGAVEFLRSLRCLWPLRRAIARMRSRA